MAKLKTCPFCGGQGIKSYHHPESDTIEFFMFYIICSFCKSRTTITAKEKDAIEIWNRRIK